MYKNKDNMYTYVVRGAEIIPERDAMAIKVINELERYFCSTFDNEGLELFEPFMEIRDIYIYTSYSRNANSERNY